MSTNGAGFRVAKNREVLWPIDIEEARPDGSGEVDVHRVRLRLRLPTKAEIHRMKYAPEAEAVETLLASIVGWEGVLDEGGAAIPFTREALADALQLVNFERAVVAGVLQAAAGAAIEKN